MAVKTLYFKNAAPSGASTSLSLQDGGTAPTAALTASGWTVAKLAANNMSAMLAGTKRASGTFSTSDAIGSFAASACWRSESAFTGVFANTNWSLAFRIRASAAVSSQTGAVKVRLWKSTNADGTGATQLTGAVQTGSTTAVLSTSASATSTVTWTPGGTVSLNNEYLWVQCEWNVVAASGNNSSDAVFYVESAGAITTPDFVASITSISAAPTEAADTAGPGSYCTIDFAGGVSGTPGTVPTGWSTGGFPGLTSSLVFGTDNNASHYMELTLTGTITPTVDGYIDFPIYGSFNTGDTWRFSHEGQVTADDPLLPSYMPQIAIIPFGGGANQTIWYTDRLNWNLRDTGDYVIAAGNTNADGVCRMWVQLNAAGTIGAGGLKL